MNPPRGRNMKRLLHLSVGVLIAMATGPAMAADLSVKGSPAPVPTPVYNWTGCHIGAQAGGGAVRDGILGLWQDGVLLGGQLGCDYQTGELVIGVEGEGAWASVREGTSVQAIGTTTVLNNSGKAPWDADVSARLGFVINQIPILHQGGPILLFMKAGIWWTEQQAFLQPAATATLSGSTTIPGFVWGLGFEYAFAPQWTAKFEADLVMYEATNITFACTGVGCAGVPTAIAPDNPTAFYAKLGVNYKFW